MNLSHIKRLRMILKKPYHAKYAETGDLSRILYQTF
jgi:hypothetical protein